MIASVAGELPERVVVDGSEHVSFVSGWHERERDGRCGIAYRAAREVGVVKLKRTEKAEELFCLLSGPRGLSPGMLRGKVRINGKDQALELDCDLWVLRRFDLAGVESDELTVEFILENAPCPDHVLHNGDGRKLGWMVSAIWQQRDRWS